MSVSFIAELSSVYCCLVMFSYVNSLSLSLSFSWWWYCWGWLGYIMFRHPCLPLVYTVLPSDRVEALECLSFYTFPFSPIISFSSQFSFDILHYFSTIFFYLLKHFSATFILNQLSYFPCPVMIYLFSFRFQFFLRIFLRFSFDWLFSPNYILIF